MKWEYLVDYALEQSPLAEGLNEFGKDGWELVVVFKADYVTYIFKRPLIEKNITTKIPPLLHVGAEEYPDDTNNDGG